MGKLSESRLKLIPGGTQPLIYFFNWCRAVVRGWEIHESRHSLGAFIESIFVVHSSQFYGAVYIRFVKEIQTSHWCFQRGFQILKLLLYFETAAYKRPNLGQILIHTFDLPVKFRGRTGVQVSMMFSHCHSRG